MLRITLTKDGGLPQVSTFDKREITIGRVPSNDLVIPEPGVSSSHARLLSTGDGLTLIDLESTNGTFVNGERIRGPSLVQPGDEVYICAYRLDFELDTAGSGVGPTPEGPPMVEDPPAAYSTTAEPPRRTMQSPEPAPAPSTEGPPPMLDGPPMVEPPAELMVEPPAALDPPPPMVPTPVAPSPVAPPTPAPLAPSPVAPPPVGTPMQADEPATPPPVGMPDAAPATPPPVGSLEPPATLSPAQSGPEPAAPPPLARPVAIPPPVEIAPPAAVEQPPSDERPTAVVSGSISAPDNIPDVTPRAASTPDLTPLVGTPVAPIYARAEGAPAAVAPTPAPVDPMAATARPAPPSDDLSDLKGPDAAAQTCARVFALVHYALAPDGGLPARDASTRARARSEAGRWLTQAAQHVPDVQARPWANRMANELCGLGALSGPLAEPGVADLYVHGPERVLVRRPGETPTTIDAQFSCPAALELVVRRLTGRPFGPSAPVVEARTADGAEVRAVHGSMASPGPLVTIHRGTVDATARGLETLVQGRALSSGLATLLHHCVRAGLNILVCGGPGASTFGWLAALTAEVPESERVVVVRPGPEPDPLPAHALVVHTGTSPSREGLSGPRWAVRGALNLAPDRLVVHEVAGPEAADVVAAMGRGLSGTLCSVRAGSPAEGLAQLVALAGLTGDRPDASARAQHVAQAIELVIAVSRFPDGGVRVTALAETTVTAEGTAQAVELLTYQANTGQWASTGITPRFFAEMQRRGIAVDVGLLDE